MADEQSAVASSSNEPSLPAVTAAPSAPAREMRQRPAAPKKLLEAGGPEPAGKAKQRKPVKKKKTTTAAVSKKKGKAAASTAKGAAPVEPAEEAGLSDLSGFLDTTAATLDGGEDAVDDNALFCICLGKDDGRPMIMCEGCENWYHLECIGITEQQAELIASYFCQLCEHAGSGKTEWLPEPPAPAATVPIPIPIPIPAAPLTPSDSGGEYEDRDYFDSKRRGGGGGDSDDDYSESGKRRRKRESASHQARKPSISSGKKRKVIEDDDDREEKEAGRSKKSNKDSISETTFYDRPAAPAKRGSMTGVRTSTPATNKTRRHCLETLENLLSGIVEWSSTEAFTSSFPSVPSDTLLTTAQIGSLAEDIEDNLYDNFGEIDPARNEKIAKAKYIAKFRTLQFNLKANDYFKSRIVTRSLTAEEVVAMAPENLLTPEARAEQEAIKQQSLAMSVKIATDKPKTRMTHKGEEVLDEFDAAGTGSANKQQDNQPAEVREDSEQRSREQSEDFNSFLLRDQEESGREDSFAMPADPSDRERSMSMSMPQASPRLEQLQQSPGVASPSAMSPQPYEDTRSPVRGTFSPVDNFAKPSSRRQSMAAPLESPSVKHDPSASPVENAASRPGLPHHSRSDSIKAKLDLDSIWGAYKSPTTPTVPAESPSAPKSATPDVAEKERKSEDDMETESDDDRPDKAKPEKKEDDDNEDAKEQAEDYDPFATIGKSTADEDFDAIMGDDTDTKKPEVAGAPSVQEEKDPFESLPTVWKGTLSNPPEEIFPARIVQVGGSNLGSHPHIWDQVLPKDAINVSARIDLKTASEYLVQIRFASTRELIVLAIIPENEANFLETAAGTEKPSMETIAKYSAFRNTLTDKKRFGVCPPSADLKNRVKDHYIVPLRKNDPLPDYIELLDEHIIPETGSRTKDYLLCVLVLKKGLAGDKAPPLSANLPAGTGSIAPSQSAVAPLQQPPLSAASQSQGIPGLTQQPQMPAFAVPSGQAGPQPGSAGFPPGMGPQPGMNGQQPPSVPGLDPSLLQGLLSNPGLLQALGSNNNPAGQMSPPAGQPGFAGGFMPQQGGSPMNQAPFGMPGQVPPQMQMQMPQGSPGWQQQQHPPFGMPPNQWGNTAGSPPWQGGPPPQNAGWGPPGPMHGSQLPPNHPGYIDPERIRMASAEARELGMRAGNRGGRPDDRRDSWRDDRRDDRRSPRDPYPPRDSDRDRDRDRDRGRDSRDSRDRDWGRDRDMRDRDRERDDWNRDRDRNRGRDDRRDDPRAGRRNSDYANRDRDSGSPRDRPGSSNQMRAGIQDKGWGRRN